MTWLDTLKSCGDIETGQSFQKLTTVQIGGQIDYVLYPRDISALLVAIDTCNKAHIEWRIIGFGSNILASDEPFHGVVIKLSRTMNHVMVQNDRVFVEAGTSLIRLAIDMAQQGLDGLTWASGIPATVGGAITMNAGAYRCDMSSIVEEVWAIDDGQVVVYPCDKCEFGYRTSRFKKRHQVVLGAWLKLYPGDVDQLSQTMKDRQQRRLQSQPLNYPSFGSTFRNLETTSAWKLIEECGLRGYRQGGAIVSDKHCNFLLNISHAKFDDMMALIETCKQKAMDQHKVKLEEEVEVWTWPICDK